MIIELALGDLLKSSKSTFLGGKKVASKEDIGLLILEQLVLEYSF